MMKNCKYYPLSCITPAQRIKGDKVVAVGATKVCTHLRKQGKSLVMAGPPEHIATLNMRPFYCDTMEGEQFVFTMEDDGTVYVQRLDSQKAIRMGRVEEEVCECAVAGDFLILRLESGKLVYIFRDKERQGYRWLGEMPELPGFLLTVREGADLTVEVPGVKFAATLTAPVNPVSEDIRRKVWEGWKEGWEELMSDLHSAGQWCGPVDVRIALRLWDGTRLHISEPVRLSIATRPGSARFYAGLVYSSDKKGFICTDNSSVTGHGFNIDVAVTSSIPSAWLGLVAGLEVWVSKEPEAMRQESEPRMAYFVVSGGNYVSFMPPLRSIEEVEGDLAAMPSGQADFIPMHTGSATVSLPADIKYDSAPLEVFTKMPGVTVKADCILGHGEFLHIGSGDDVYTSVRGNPLVVKDVSLGVGQRVRSMRAQYTGGGAFTRQYIYLSTDRGVIALTHKPDGEHTNVRPVSRELLSAGELWLSTPQGVFALTGSGSLLRLRDAQAPVILSGLSGVERLLWSNSYQELWLEFATGVLAIQTAGGYTVFTRSDKYFPLPGADSPALVWREDAHGYVYIHTLEEESETPVVSAYTTELFLSEGPWLRRMEVRAEGAGKIRYAVTTLTGRKVCIGESYAPLEGVVCMTLVLPRLGKKSRCSGDTLIFKIEGGVTSINEISIRNGQ